MMRSNALFWLFLVGIACAEVEKLHSQNQFDGPFTDVVMKRLAVLEDKELENDVRINALEEEVLDLRLKAKEDHLEILRLNRELELSSGRCENSKQRINQDQENNVSGGSDDPKENPVLRSLADELVTANTDKTGTGTSFKENLHYFANLLPCMLKLDNLSHTFEYYINILTLLRKHARLRRRCTLIVLISLQKGLKLV